MKQPLTPTGWRGRPRLLDAFCCAGGAGEGYWRAGFAVTGVDIEPQPNYRAGHFVRADAIEFIRDHGHEFDVIHASPPCDRYTAGAGQWGTRDKHPDLIAATRAAIYQHRKPYVIENVEGARADLYDPLLLCGTTFGLGVFRHRLFETNRVVWQPEHQKHTGSVGDGRFVTVVGNPGGRSRRDGVTHGDTADWRHAMGISWMTAKELREAIPPKYTEYIGTQLIRSL